MGRRPRDACKSIAPLLRAPRVGAVGRTCICTRFRARASEARVSSFHHDGVCEWGDRPVSIRDQRVHGARCRPLHHDHHWSGQGGWSRSSGLRLPKPALFPLSYALIDGLPHLESHQAPVGYRPTALMLSYAAVGDPCSRRKRRRTAAPQTWPSPAEPGCAVRGVFIPGGKTGSAKWVRTTMKRINSALPCHVGHRGKLVDPLRLERRPDGLRVRCAAITPRVIIAGASRAIRTPARRGSLRRTPHALPENRPPSGAEASGGSGTSRTCTARRRVGYSHLGSPVPQCRTDDCLEPP